jgi:hypothetical protein
VTRQLLDYLDRNRLAISSMAALREAAVTADMLTQTQMSRFTLAHTGSKSKSNLTGLTCDLEGRPAGYFERPKYLRSGGGWSFLDGISLPSTLI